MNRVTNEDLDMSMDVVFNMLAGLQEDIEILKRLVAGRVEIIGRAVELIKEEKRHNRKFKKGVEK